MRKMTKEQNEQLRKALSIQWNGNEKMIKYCMKSSKYIFINGKFIDCCNSKPPIKKTMWYDDETEGPDKNYDNFEALNTRSLKEKLNTSKYNYFIISQYTGDITNGLLCSVASLSKWEDVIPDNYIKATDEEINAVSEALQEVEADFKKRLKTYWKKYSSNVSARGYWANR